jgi:hypothetical protein
METEYINWSRAHFNIMREGATWAVQRSGLIFQRRGDTLVLREAMPYEPGMPITPAQLQDCQDKDFAIIKAYFEAAGIPVKSDVDHFNNLKEGFQDRNASGGFWR